MTADLVLTGASIDAPRHSMSSASGLERLEKCPASGAILIAAAVPVATVDDDDEESTDATRGTSGHAFLENIQRGMPRAAALALCVPDVLDACEGIRLASLPKGRPEVAYVLDVQTWTVRELPRTTHRGYGALSDDEIPGTADLIVPAENNNGLVMVVDWKFGFEQVTPAAQNLQIQFHAVIQEIVTGATEVAGAIYRFDEEGRCLPDVHVFDAFELADARERLSRIHAAVQSARASVASGEAPKAVDGSHCKWCPAKPSCPIYAAEAATLARIGDGWDESIRSQLADNDGASYWWAKIERAEHVLKAVKSALRDRATHTPIVLPDGHTVRLVPGTRRTIDGKRALRVISDQFGAEFAKAASDVKVTQKSLREACGELTEDVMAALAADGAIRDIPTTSLRKVKSR